MPIPAQLNLEELRERCAYWQKVLRLQDWDVSLKIVRKRELRPYSIAQVWTDNVTRTATISFAHEMDYEPCGEETDARIYDREDSLVHELLHLHTHDCRIPDPGAENDPRHVAHERVIEAIAFALITLERRAKQE